jgi:hypothetical protein
MFALVVSGAFVPIVREVSEAILNDSEYGLKVASFQDCQNHATASGFSVSYADRSRVSQTQLSEVSGSNEALF